MISIQVDNGADGRPAYNDFADLQQKANPLYNTLFEDSVGRFVLLPNGWYYDPRESDCLIFTPEMKLVRQSSEHKPGQITWPVRPARSSVKIVIQGDA